jgi:large repetitive protein
LKLSRLASSPLLAAPAAVLLLAGIALAGGGERDASKRGPAECAGKPAEIIGTSGDDQGAGALTGTSGGDVILSLEGDDEIDGGGGNDRICAGPGNDEATGGDGNDRIQGGQGNDMLVGGDGDDKLSGQRGKDQIFGDADDDVLRGGQGKDGCLGGPGQDKQLACEGKANRAPTAVDDIFNGTDSAVGNTPLAVGTSQAQPRKALDCTTPADCTVLARGTDDFDVDGPTQLVAGPTGPQAITTSDGGKVTMQADGNFTYFPPANDPGCTDASDSFDYTLSDGGTNGTDTGTVTIAVADCVWYVNNSLGSNGTGTADSPFNALSGVNATGGAGDADAAGDTLFILNTGSYPGGLPLENNQRLFSPRFGLSFPGFTIAGPSGGASNPTITNAAGNALTLASGNTVQAIDLGTAGGAGSASLAGSSVGTAVMNNAGTGTGSINNASGKAVDISGGALNMAFTGVSSSGSGTDGIRLDNVTGTFDAAGGSLQNATGEDIDITGGASADDANITYGGTISDASGTVVSVSGQGGGTKDFNGAIGTAGSPAGAISLSSNTGATVRFDGGTILSTAGTNAFSATGGGTVSVTDPNAVGTAPDNTLTTTTGTALNVASTTIGTSDLNFRSVSSNGAPSGIVLNGTGSSGNLTITGAGGTTASGGTIQNSTSDGVSLNNTAAPSLSYLTVAGTGGHGMNVQATSDLTLTGTQVNDAGNGEDERGLNLINATGTVTLSGAGFNNAAEQLAYVEKASGSLTFIVRDSSTFQMPSSISANASQGIEIHPNGTSSITATVQESTFTNIRGDGIRFSAQTLASSGSSSVTITDNTFTVNLAGRANGVSISGQENTTTAISISGPNTFTGSGGNGVISIDVNDASTVTGTVGPNTINNPPGNGMFLAVDENALATVVLNNNTVNNAGVDGIQVVNFAGVGESKLNATVTNNTVAGHSGNAALAFVGGISMTAFGDSAGDVTKVTLRGNTVTGTPASPAQCGGAPCVAYYLDETAPTNPILEEVPNTGATVATVPYIQSINNPAGASVNLFGSWILSDGVPTPGP